MAAPLLVNAEFVFSAEGEAEYLTHHERTLHEVASTPGCLQAVAWRRSGRRYQFSTLWADAESVTRWVENEFHRSVLMPGFRTWCTEGCFGEFRLESDHQRARKCAHCGRWTKTLPGWDEREPSQCGTCGTGMDLSEL